MSIDYKAAYLRMNKVYKALLTERMTTACLPMLLDWIRDAERKEAIFSFTEGPERTLAYAIERAIKVAATTTDYSAHLAMRPTTQCPKCGYVEIVPEDVINLEAAKHSLAYGIKYPYDDHELRRMEDVNRPAIPHDWAHAAALGAIANLTDRRGIKNEFNDVQLNTRIEIVSMLADIIRLAYMTQQGAA